MGRVVAWETIHVTNGKKGTSDQREKNTCQRIHVTKGERIHVAPRKKDTCDQQEKGACDQPKKRIHVTNGHREEVGGVIALF